MPIPTKEQVKQAYNAESFEKIVRRVEDYVGNMMITNAKEKRRSFNYYYNITGPLKDYGPSFNKEVITKITAILESKGYVMYRNLNSESNYCHIDISLE